MSTTSFRDPRTYVVHLLRVLQKHGGASPPAEIYDEVADRAGVTHEEREIEGAAPSDNPVYRNRIQFARQTLIDAGALIGSAQPGWQRGVWELTPEGARLARASRADGDLDAILRTRAAEGARKRAKEREASRALAGLDEDEEDDDHEVAHNEIEGDAEPLEEDDESPKLRIAKLVVTANDAALRTMLDHVRAMSDRAFEHLVGAVLRAALRAESVKVTQKSRDGGVDGVLHFDGLGMRVAVFEAKRYAEDNKVRRSQVDAFATAARRRRASHALFVTSSRFSPEAIATGVDEGIRLIDGMAFVELMAQHGIGLRPRDTFVLYEIDPAWSVGDPAED
jgi:restriction system protein